MRAVLAGGLFEVSGLPALYLCVRLTEQGMLEHAVGLNLVEGRLEKAFLFELVIIVVANSAELLSLSRISVVTKCRVQR